MVLSAGVVTGGAQLSESVVQRRFLISTDTGEGSCGLQRGRDGRR